MDQLLLTLPPGPEDRGNPHGLLPAYMAYRVGPGPKLLGARLPPALRGGLMAVDCRDFDTQGDPLPCCRQILAECRRRGFRGVVCDFEAPPVGCLPKLTDLLSRGCADQGWTLYVPESYAPHAPSARLLIPSRLTAGTLERRLRSLLGHYPPERLALAVEWVREDFPLPAGGRGQALSQEELADQLRRLEPAVFFDRGLCAHYYTYMTAGGQAHFVLFDSPRSLREKLAVARRLGLAAALLPGPEVAGCLEELLLPE